MRRRKWRKADKIRKGGEERREGKEGGVEEERKEGGNGSF